MSKLFAIKDVMDFEVESYVQGSTRGNILLNVYYAGDTNFVTNGERINIRAGIGNVKMMSLDHSRDSMFNAMLPFVNLDSLAIKLGVSNSTGAVSVPKLETLVSTGATPTITLSATPVSGTLKVYSIVSGTERDLDTEQTAGVPASTPNEYSISGAVVTLNATSGAAGTSFYVSYDYTSGSAAETVIINADDFPSFITIRGRGFIDDEQVEQRIPVTFIIHKAKVKPDFELTMNGEAVTELNFEVDIFPIKNTTTGKWEECKITKLNDEAV